MGLFDYFKTVWEDSPAHTTPISADNLNKMENGIEQANQGLAQAPVIYAKRETDVLAAKRLPGRRLQAMPAPPVITQASSSAIAGAVFTGVTVGGLVYPSAQVPFDFGNRNDQLDTVRNIYTTAGYPNSYPYNATVAPSPVKGAPAGIYYNSGWFPVRFATDAPVVEIIGMPAQSQSDARFYVDGLFAGVIAPNAASPYSVFRLSFGSRQMRVIEMEGGVWFTGVNVDAQSVLDKPPSLSGPKVAWLGDSVLQGTGADVGQTGFGFQTSRILGWDRVSVHAQGGTGYTSNLGGALQTFIQRVPAIIAEQPDVVIVEGGYNDGDDAATWAAAVVACFQALRAGLPNAKLIFVGPWGNLRAGRYALYLSRWQAVSPALAAHPGLADGTVDTIQTLGPWFTGSGWSGAPAGDGNSDFYIWTDGIHFSQAGHDYAAHRLAAAVSRILGYQSMEPHPLAQLAGVYAPLAQAIPTGGSDGQVLGHAAGSPAWVTAPVDPGEVA